MTLEMPIQEGYCHRTRTRFAAFSIPWGMIEKHEEQAKMNHSGQNLCRLRERHGISPCEALAILDNRAWKKMDIFESHAELLRRVDDYNKGIAQ